jgi:hypothetical protein
MLAASPFIINKGRPPTSDHDHDFSFILVEPVTPDPREDRDEDVLPVHRRAANRSA